MCTIVHVTVVNSNHSLSHIHLTSRCQGRAGRARIFMAQHNVPSQPNPPYEQGVGPYIYWAWYMHGSWMCTSISWTSYFHMLISRRKQSEQHLRRQTSLLVWYMWNCHCTVMSYNERTLIRHCEFNTAAIAIHKLQWADTTLCKLEQSLKRVNAHKLY